MRRKIIGSLIFLVAFTVCAGIVWRSSDYQNCQTEKTQKSSDQKTEKRNSVFIVSIECAGRFTDKNHDSIIAIFTIVLGFGTFLIWWATRDLVEGAERTAERQLRAYVHVEDAQLSHANDEWRPCISVAIKNYGQTPARRVRHKIGNALVMSGPGNFAVEPDESVCDLGPSQGFTKTFHTNREFWNSMTKPAIIAKTGIYYVFGEITYSDVFNPKKIRRTTYRFQVRADGEGVTDGGLFFAKEGNHSD